MMNNNVSDYLVCPGCGGTLSHSEPHNHHINSFTCLNCKNEYIDMHDGHIKNIHNGVVTDMVYSNKPLNKKEQLIAYLNDIKCRDCILSSECEKLVDFCVSKNLDETITLCELILK